LAIPFLKDSGLLAQCAVKRLSQLLSPAVSKAACAFALAVLASELSK
jgi:hypothetical protein